MPDGEELDAYYLGTDKALDKATGVCIAVVRRDHEDDDKLVAEKLKNKEEKRKTMGNSSR